MKAFTILTILLPACLAAPSSVESNNTTSLKSSELSPDNGRIMGGATAPKGAFPYQVSLRNLENKHFCGGSIITARHVLSAAHCFVGASPDRIIVVVGTNLLNKGGFTHKVEKIVSHEGYVKETYLNDIAILTVNPRFNINAPGISIVPLASRSRVVTNGEKLFASGWGFDDYPKEDSPNSMQYIQLTGMDAATCASKMPGSPIKSGHICTQDQKGLGTCMGDSGGPLVDVGGYKGIVSWGIPCAQGKPDVFTSVAYYKHWIEEKQKTHKPKPSMAPLSYNPPLTCSQLLTGSTPISNGHVCTTSPVYQGSCQGDSDCLLIDAQGG
ncbi:LOW QUALITY PROTEIN: chymotrypsin-2-like [Atheta coriaria]|uniref:LOW QUALITY PROTEIN: chymotrypsin-2-like n=1 Tax=Dalotia coriaria TaxID=877792 RepID=UPI0031F44138